MPKARTQRRLPVIAAAGGVVLHFFVSVALLLILISAAYGFAGSVPGGGEVSSIDQLHKLGASPSLGIFALAMFGLLDFVLTVFLLAVPRTRQWAFVAPVTAIVTSGLVALLAILAFQPPAPDIGG